MVERGLLRCSGIMAGIVPAIQIGALRKPMRAGRLLDLLAWFRAVSSVDACDERGRDAKSAQARRRDWL